MMRLIDDEIDIAENISQQLKWDSFSFYLSFFQMCADWVTYFGDTSFISRN